MRRVKPRKLRTGTEAERPAAGVVDRFYFETDTRTIHRDNGAAWEVFVPDIAITDTSVVGSQAEMLALAAQKGDVAIRTDVSKCFVLAAAPASELGNWKELLTPPDAVLSVNGEVGAVDLDAADVGALDADDFLLSGLGIDSDLNLAGYKLKFTDVRMKQWDATTLALMNHAETLYMKMVLDILFPYTISYQQTETGVLKTRSTATASVDFQSHNGAVFQSAAKLLGGYFELARGKLTGALLGTDDIPIYFDTAGTKSLKWVSGEDRFEMADRLVASRLGDLAPGGGDFLVAAHGESDGMPEDGNVAGFIATFKGSASDDATSVFIGHGGDFDRNASPAKAVMFACPDDGGWDWGAILGAQSGLASDVPLYFDVDMDAITGTKCLKWDSVAENFEFNDDVKVAGFKMPTDASAGYVLTSDADGVGTWQEAAGGITSLSELTIDADKDWNGKSITNLNGLSSIGNIYILADAATLELSAYGLSNEPSILLTEIGGEAVTLSVDCPDTLPRLKIDNASAVIAAGVDLGASGEEFKDGWFAGGIYLGTADARGHLWTGGQDTIEVGAHLVPEDNDSYSLGEGGETPKKWKDGWFSGSVNVNGAVNVEAGISMFGSDIADSGHMFPSVDDSYNLGVGGVTPKRFGEGFFSASVHAPLFQADATQLTLQPAEDFGVEIGNFGDRPAAGAGYRGQLWLERGATEVRDRIYLCMKSDADAYSWVEIVNGGA